MSLLDWILLVFYFALLGVVAWWAIKGKRDASTSYFLADRDMSWWLVGASLFTANIGSEHLVGLAGAGAASGLAVSHFEWLACFLLLLLGWLFVPFYLNSGVVTMPEFLERRYGRSSRWYFSFISIVAYVLTKISVSLYAGGIILKEVTGLDFWVSIPIVVIITGIYTALGGLRAVVYTDTMQAVILILGASLLVFLGLEEVGGWAALQAKAPSGFFSIWKPAEHPNFPWTGIIFGAPILGLWYWCTDQNIVQRVLSAKNISHARAGSIFAGYLKLLPPFLFVIPGILAAVLYPQIMQDKTADFALPTLVLHLMQPGLRGLFVAALLAALMSSLSAVFNSCSTLITWDIYKKLRPSAKESELVNFGRGATAVLVLLGLLWIPFMSLISGQLFIYLQSVQGYLAPPIAACFLLGLFMPRLNGTGAIVSLIAGFIAGALRLILELIHAGAAKTLPKGSLWAWLAEVNFLHFSSLLFLLCSGILIVTSYLSAAPEPQQLAGLTWQTRKTLSLEPSFLPAVQAQIQTTRRRQIALSVLLIAAVVGLWVYFR